jgi:hypothetical protein
LCHVFEVYIGNNILAESKDSGQDGGGSLDDVWLPRGFEFLSGLPTENRKRRNIVVIQAFLDESGTKGTHPVFTFAGFIGRAEVWARLSQEWSLWLKASPRIEYLKMAEAAKLNEQFRSFSARQRDEKLKGFVEIIKKHLPQWAIQVSVEIDEWWRVIAPDTPKMLSDPYFMSFWGILLGVCCEMLDTQAPDEFEVIFDEHSIFRPRINLWYSFVRDMLAELHDEALGRLMPPSPLFRDDKVFLPLQASDVLAWLFRTALSGERTEFEWIAEELAPHIPLSRYSTTYTGERIEQVRTLSFELQKKMTPERIRAWQQKYAIGLLYKADRKANRKMRKQTEFEAFDNTMHKLIRVTHTEIKAKLDAEKAEKAKKKREPKASASDHVSGEKD